MDPKKCRRGSAILEFTLTGIPFIFVWIGVVQMSIGMWQYHTIQYAVKEAGTYVTLHGSDCGSPGNSCLIAVKDVANLLKTDLIGVDPTAVTVTLNAMASDHVTVASTVTCQLSGGGNPCTSNSTTWPPSPYNLPGTDIEIKTEFQFKSALAMVAPGGSGGGTVQFGTIWLPGFTHQTIVF